MVEELLRGMSTGGLPNGEPEMCNVHLVTTRKAYMCTHLTLHTDGKLKLTSKSPGMKMRGMIPKITWSPVTCGKRRNNRVSRLIT